MTVRLTLHCNIVVNEDYPLIEQSDDPIESSPKSSAWQSSPPTNRSVRAAPKAKGRFLTFKKADDRDDFKAIKARPSIQTSDMSNLKMSNKTSDGFNDDEKHAGPRWRQRRINSSDTRMGSLELTQKGTFTQKLQGPTWPRGQKKSRTSSIASLWSSRQYLGDSQIKESHDPLESSEEKKEPCARNETKNGNRKARHRDIEEPNEVDEEIGLLVFPPDDVDDDDGPVANENDDEVSLLVEPDELGEEANVDFVTIPNTDTMVPDENVALNGRSAF